ncbi:Oxidoreductase, molybdopterin-binding domain-containing protein [Clohesyomyces aquaticus]|uniref:Oxidoreductase, molybdopterin-binding domain-containing protein n=1 Tax=Clohesyomyces aquaticus TaxID=1231657 RepID=A0A1Y1YBY6_9PLEO|nr:Oxidoreductase, molybdopterin-binding domain-containing protein [Clohesyomyces aquaticus]
MPDNHDKSLSTSAHTNERDAFIRLSSTGFQIRHPPPPHELSSFITPDTQLFQTIHMGAAVVELSKYILVMDGLVPKPLILTLPELQQLPQTSITAFHECYGSPLTPPTKALWRIGNVQWTGVRLSHLLERAGYTPSSSAQFVWSEGLDSGVFASVMADRYQKDLPIAKALQPETLVAYAMNGQPLTKERGGPVRLVVPGFFGTNSTKWLCRISVQRERAPGPYTTRFYNEIDPEDPEGRRMRPVWNVEVNSVITRPRPAEVVKGSRVRVEGWAWGDSAVGRIEVSYDEGRTWDETEAQERVEYSWQRFEAEIELPPGDCMLLARATSLTGQQQPLENRRNHAHRVNFSVVAD